MTPIPPPPDVGTGNGHALPTPAASCHKLTRPHGVNTSAPPKPDRLVDGPGLLAALFEEATRPSLRTLARWTKSKFVPYYRVGRLVRFDPVQVRAALDAGSCVPAKKRGSRAK